MATGIYRQGKGSWRVTVSAGLDETTGKYRQVSRTVKGTNAEAQVRRAQLLAEVSANPDIEYGATMSDLLEKWLPLARISPATREDYRRIASNYLLPAFALTKVHRLRPSDLDQFYARLAQTLGPARIYRVHTVLRSALSQAVRWEWITNNPAKNATPPAVPRSHIEPPSPNGVVKLIEEAATSDPWLLTFIVLAAATGARRGELCGLRWGDFEDGALRIRRSVCVLSGSVVVKETKTGDGRVVALDDVTLAEVAAHRRRCREMALAWGAPLEAGSYLFCRDGYPDVPWRGDVVGHRFSRLRARAGQESVRLHDLRHYVASQLIGAGVDPVTVAGRLGHRRPSTTLDMYSAFLPAKDRDSAELLAGLLRRAR